MTCRVSLRGAKRSENDSLIGSAVREKQTRQSGVTGRRRAVGIHMHLEQTIKMTKFALGSPALYYRGSCIGITSQFLDCNRVGGEAAEGEGREEKQRRAELHDRAAAAAAAGRQAPVMD